MLSSDAAEELEDDELDILDHENIVLTGEIIEHQTDRRTGEAKYVLQGVTLADDSGCVVAKFDSIGRAVIITVYLECVLRKCRGVTSPGYRELRSRRDSARNREDSVRELELRLAAHRANPESSLAWEAVDREIFGAE